MAGKIILHYKRLRDEVEGEYPFQGKLVVYHATEVRFELPFISLLFKDIIRELHKQLVSRATIKRVILQRTEHDNIPPMELDSNIVKLLRRDPLAAYRSLTYEPQGDSFHSTYTRIAGAQRRAEAEQFGEYVYLDIAKGNILSPLTGDWEQLAYGDKHGWKIREKGNNKANSWLPIALIDDAPAGTPFAMRVAFARWAVVSTHSLLARQAERYYLPRSWNSNEDPWMSYEQLKAMLAEHRKEEQCQHPSQKVE